MSKKAPPPLLPILLGKPHTFAMPTAEPTEAKIKPHRLANLPAFCLLFVFIKILLIHFLFAVGAKAVQNKKSPVPRKRDRGRKFRGTTSGLSIFHKMLLIVCQHTRNALSGVPVLPYSSSGSCSGTYSRQTVCFLSPAGSSLQDFFCSTIFLLRILLFLSTVPYCLWNVKSAEIKSFCFFSANTFHSSGYTVYPFLFYFSLFCDISAFGTPSIIALICFSAQKIKQPANKKHYGFLRAVFYFF